LEPLLVAGPVELPEPPVLDWPPLLLTLPVLAPPEVPVLEAEEGPAAEPVERPVSSGRPLMDLRQHPLAGGTSQANEEVRPALIATHYVKSAMGRQSDRAGPPTLALPRMRGRGG